MSIQFIDLKRQYQLLKSSIDARMARVLEHGQYILGPEVAELEAKLKEFTGAAHAIGVASGTDALMAVMMALDLAPGDEVIMPAFTFVAPAEVACLLRAKPVFVDVDPATFLIRPDLVGAAITPRTKAIVAVSLFGQTADFGALNAIAAKHGIPVIEDAAQSFGARSAGRRSCALTELSITSFFPAKPLGCYGDAGAVFCADERLARKIRQISQHGQEKRYHYVHVGFNGRIDTLQAAILLAKLEAFPAEIEAREAAARRYDRLLAAHAPGAVRPRILASNESVWAQYTVRVPGREAVKASLEKNGIPTAIHYPESLTRQPAYRADTPAPESERAAAEVLSLPLHPYLNEGEQEQVAKALGEALGHR